jgi:hypothetical protein
MRTSAPGLMLLAMTTSLVLSCKKHNENTYQSLIQHKWKVVSFNGEALRYIGQPADFWEFDANGRSIESVDSINNTDSYSLSTDGKTLVFQPLVGLGPATRFNVKTLTDSQLILSQDVPGHPITITDATSPCIPLSTCKQIFICAS